MTHVQFSSDGKLLATPHSGGSFKLWDVKSGQELVTLRGHATMVRRIVFSPDLRTIATTAGLRRINIWTLKQNQERTTLREHEGSVIAVEVSPDGKSIASVGGAAGYRRDTKRFGEIN
ncbi:MAG: WD40 repeat domain-containing protein [Gemmataceae bacterium]